MTANQINFARLQEDKRHNLKSEAQTDRNIVEGERHNREIERTNWYSAQNQAGIGWGNLSESQRHNTAVEDIDRSYKQSLGDLNVAKTEQQQAQNLITNETMWYTVSDMYDKHKQSQATTTIKENEATFAPWISAMQVASPLLQVGGKLLTTKMAN